MWRVASLINAYTQRRAVIVTVTTCLLLEFLSTHKNVASAHIFSAGLGARLTVIHEIVAPRNRLNLALSVLVQHPDTHLDRLDAARLSGQLALIQQGDIPASQLFETRLSRTPATIRALIVCAKSSKPVWASASWYVYRSERGTAIKGRDNPTFILDGLRHPEYRDVLVWLYDTLKSRLERRRV